MEEYHERQVKSRYPWRYRYGRPAFYFAVVFLYVFPVQVFNVLVVGVLTIYSIMFAYNLLRVIVSKKGNNRLMLKRYLIILSFSIIISFISSFLEVYFFPNILKIIISIYV